MMFADGIARRFIGEFDIAVVQLADVVAHQTGDGLGLIRSDLCGVGAPGQNQSEHEKNGSFHWRESDVFLT